MTWFRCGGGGSGIPAALKNRMNAVLNKKFGTAVDYPPNGWPDDVNLLGELKEKTAASASVCSFDDGADDVPTKSLVVTIPPTLSGVSSLTETQTGRNLVDFNSHLESSYSGLTISGGADGSISFSGTPSRTWAHLTTDFDIDLPVGSYIIGRSGSSASYAVYIAVRYEDGTTENISMALTNSKTFTTTKKINRIRLDISSLSTSVTYNETFFVMLENGSTAHTYEPYTTPTQYTASLGRTIYGGQADIVNGTGKDTHKGYTLDNLTWSGGIVGGADWCWYVDLSADGLKLPANSAIFSGICDNYTPIRYNGVATNQNTIALRSNGFLYVNNGSETTQPTGKVTIELDTPTDFTFTGQEVPTRLGVNNFWSDSGDTEVTYRGQGTLTPITPTLITKTITANGSYQADDDQADGYSEVVVNVSGGSCERLFYARCYDNYQVEIPTISSLVQGTNYSSYVSYDTTTKKFTALQDFTAVIIGWVYTYQTYEASYSQGAFVVNNKRLSTYTATGKSQGSTGGAYMVYNLKQGDTFYPYTPSTDGYPRQNCKVYLVSDLNDDIYTFADENA